ncbi:hypothetical protein [Neobacillus vireti]|uniref:Uncharacterized protein n=1 Tax=Neobacillus vireti LMG 21834 TaxID=1131730 RepID=A0AB94IJM2_9BACI|nr:hypothetical protein [Neobacillus vireti]ETI67256.1 hypothetical protein BAVI_18442 [Neobacillus vireti LMG 21834]KLT19651.1 hypothetical protein AA980_03410 [Neobacillus vireti]
MFQTINGVQIREHDETKAIPNLTEKRFEIEYLDNVYLNKVVCIDIINIPVKGHQWKYGIKRLKDYGRMWMYVIKHNDFAENRKKYGEVCNLIHDKIGVYLQKEYGLNPVGSFIIDSMDKVYK